MIYAALRAACLDATLAGRSAASAAAVPLLVAQVGDRISPSTEVQHVAGAARVAFTEVDDEDRYSDAGNARLNTARFQFDVFAPTLTQARTIADLLRDALDGFAGTAKGTRIELIRFAGGRFGRGDLAPGANAAVARVTRDATVTYRT